MQHYTVFLNFVSWWSSEKITFTIESKSIIHLQTTSQHRNLESDSMIVPRSARIQDSVGEIPPPKADAFVLRLRLWRDDLSNQPIEDTLSSSTSIHIYTILEFNRYLLPPSLPPVLLSIMMWRQHLGRLARRRCHWQYVTKTTTMMVRLPPRRLPAPSCRMFVSATPVTALSAKTINVPSMGDSISEVCMYICL